MDLFSYVYKKACFSLDLVSLITYFVDVESSSIDKDKRILEYV
jgi:hypothetical protein